MYRVLKEKGNNMNIVLENTETKASIVIGRLTIDILSILEKEGVHFGDSEGEIQLKDKWDITIGDETAKKLSAKAMRMSKPIRDQRKVKEEPKKSNKEIDALDVLLGLANYNQIRLERSMNDMEKLVLNKNRRMAADQQKHDQMKTEEQYKR